MTNAETLSLASEKVSHWMHKRDHATAMLVKWIKRLEQLKAKGKAVPTATKLPPVNVTSASEKKAALEKMIKAVKPVKPKLM